MSDFDTDIEQLEQALRLFSQTAKRPQRWAMITQQAGISIDRPSAFILQIMQLHAPQQLRVQDLAIKLGVEPPSITRKTQELELSGYILRTPDPKDKRAISLQLTAAGGELANKLRAAGREAIREAFTNWSDNDRQTFAHLFERFSHDFAATIEPEHEPNTKGQE
jgi:DNA-binding MarR family transcriptional regulator